MRKRRHALSRFDSLESRLHLASQTYDWDSVAIKANGFVNGVVYSPAEENLLYAYTDMGGAYRWDQTLAQWTPLNDWSKQSDFTAKHMGIEGMAVDPVDADRVYMVIGTYNSPAGMLRSSDRGHTWARTNLPDVEVHGNGNGRNGGDRLVVDPNKTSDLWYGTRMDGLWRSTNSGANWTRVDTFPVTGDSSGNGDDVGIISVVIDPTTGTAGNASQTLYAAVSTSAADKIYRSTDGGVTWNPLTAQPATVVHPDSTADDPLAPLPLYPTRMALTPDGNSLYIAYATHPGPNGSTSGAFFKVTNLDAAPVWTDLKPGGNTPRFGYSGISIDPANPNTIYVSTLDRWWPNDEIYRSTNGGTNWKALTPKGHLDNSSAPYANSISPHWVGDIDVDPFASDTMTFTTGYGIYRTTNLDAPATTANPVNWTFFNEGIEQTAVTELVSPNTGPVNLFSAVGDRDGYRHADFNISPPEGRMGQNNDLDGGTSPDLDAAWGDANYLVRVVRSSPYLQFSSNNGITWNWIAGTPGTNSTSGNVAINHDGTCIVYEPGDAGQVLYSTRSGSTWSAWTAPATNQPANGAKLVNDLTNSETFYAIAGRTVSRSTDGGVNWTVMSTNVVPSGVNWMRSVPGQAGHLIVEGDGNGVWRSTNGGTSWTRLATSAATYAYAVGVGAAAPASSYPTLYIAGTVSGVTGFHRSTDQGATWISISDKDQQFGQITVIQGDPRVYGRLYVGANGRGVLVGNPLAASASLPAGWIRNDIGSPALVGISGQANGLFTLGGNGTGIAGASDQFHFAHGEAGGDSTISARVTEVRAINAESKAGVMFRAGTANNAPFAMVARRADGRVVLLYRATTGGSVVTGASVGSYAGAKYVKLVRSGNQFTASYSIDNVNWTQIGSPVAITMPLSIRAGLAAVAHDATLLAEATVTNVVVVTDLVAPLVQSSRFDYRPATKQIEIVFSENVVGSLSIGDISIAPSAGGDAFTPTSFVYDAATNTARFALPSTMAIGDYVATFQAGNATDAAGNGTATAVTIPFFHLPGDVDRDRAVNFGDLLILAQNYGSTSATFEQGDMTGDGAVGFDDLLVLAQNYNATALQAPAATTSTKAKRRGQTPIV